MKVLRGISWQLSEALDQATWAELYLFTDFPRFKTTEAAECEGCDLGSAEESRDGQFPTIDGLLNEVYICLYCWR